MTSNDFDFIVERVLRRTDELGEQIANRYVAELPSYVNLDPAVIERDVRAAAVTNIMVLMDSLRSGGDVSPGQLEVFRRSGARRLHQGIPLSELLEAYLIWGEEAWQAFLQEIDLEDMAEVAVALASARFLFRHVHLAGAAAVAGYLREAEYVWDRTELSRYAAIESVLLGDFDTRAAPEILEQFGLSSTSAVVVARIIEPESSDLGLARSKVEVMSQFRTRLGMIARHVVTGFRDDHIYVLVPITEAEDLGRIESGCARILEEFGQLAIGIGGWHPGWSGIYEAYSEAREAAVVSSKLGLDRPVQFASIQLEATLRNTAELKAVVDRVVTPLRRYDEEHQTELWNTLTVWFEMGNNLTKAAKILCVHPNTVVYRLTRVAAITGCDVQEPRGQFVMSLCLMWDKLND